VADERTAKLALGWPRRDALVFRADLLLSSGGSGAFSTMARICAPASRAPDVVDVHLGERLRDALGELVVREEVVEGLRGGGESAGDAHAAGGELADQLAQRRVLAADGRDVGHAQ
jgi:hypothetical protein